MNEWIEIKKGLHPSNTRLLIRINMMPYREDTKNLITIAKLSYFIDEFLWFPDDTFTGFEGVQFIPQNCVTHWMPLPSIDSIKE